MQLTKGMYGTEFRRSDNVTFGLRCGQMRHLDQLTHNSGWYNGLGEKLGFGDLNGNDILRIMCEIEPGEVFIVLSENDSFWQSNTTDDQRVDVENPGVDYLVEHAMFVITLGEVRRSDYRWHRASRTATLRGLGEVDVISREEILQLCSTQKV